MDASSLDLFHLFLFLMPGFFVVHFYTKAKGTKIESDFEYFMFSMFWGLILFAFFQACFKDADKEKFISIISQPYSAAIVFSILGIYFSYIVGYAFKNAPFIYRKIKQKYFKK